MTNYIRGLLTLLLLPCCAYDKQPTPVEEVIRFQSDGVTLEGSLNLPDSKGKYPLAIFVHGSGMRTRDDFRSFVRAFNDAGMAIFRYDKRGIGNSGGTYTDVGIINSERMFGVLANDAVSAIAHLKKDDRIDETRIIVAGVSQAGWIIPEINTRTNVHLSICISGPAVSVGEEIYYSDLAEHGSYSQEQADTMLRNYHGPKGFEPVARIIRMKNPSLWLFGEKDVSIPVKRSMYVLDSIRTNGKIPLEMKMFPNADHGLYNVSTHRPEDIVSVIVKWAKEKLDTSHQ